MTSYNGISNSHHPPPPKKKKNSTGLKSMELILRLRQEPFLGLVVPGLKIKQRPLPDSNISKKAESKNLIKVGSPPNHGPPRCASRPAGQVPPLPFEQF